MKEKHQREENTEKKVRERRCVREDNNERKSVQNNTAESVSADEREREQKRKRKTLNVNTLQR